MGETGKEHQECTCCEERWVTDRTAESLHCTPETSNTLGETRILKIKQKLCVLKAYRVHVFFHLHLPLQRQTVGRCSVNT